MGFLTILTIISEYSKQTVFFSIVLKAGWPKTLFSLRGQKLTFVYFFFSFPAVRVWHVLGGIAFKCINLYGFGRNAGTFPSLFNVFSGIFRRRYFFFIFFFTIFFQGGQDGQNSGIPENSGELDRLILTAVAMEKCL